MATTSTLDLNNIQGDILEGLPKRRETFLFFKINDAKGFCAKLLELLDESLITTGAQCQDDRKRIEDEKRRARDAHTTPSLLEMSGVNIAFTQKGLDALSIGDDIGDKLFSAGMEEDAKGGPFSGLGDDLSLWDSNFKGQMIHGVLLITASSDPKLDKVVEKVQGIFESTIEVLKTLEGRVRRGDSHGHEHFGFADGISQPAIDGLSNIAHRGQETIHQGIILAGRQGDNVTRPTWALDGSFLCFRYLRQLVPEFNEFLKNHAVQSPDATGPMEAGHEGDLLGARLVGRWKSGAPVHIAPVNDDRVLGASTSHNDAFRYDPTSQKKCPFAAHTRKTNPRDDLLDGRSEPQRILRRGIQFGREVTQGEIDNKLSSDDADLERGLLFVSYQSNIFNGFHFLQVFWANNTGFPDKIDDAGNKISPGFDPIIGRGARRSLVGHDPANATTPLELDQDWVVPKGGEYFFSPSISALRDTFAQAG